MVSQQFKSPDLLDERLRGYPEIRGRLARPGVRSVSKRSKEPDDRL